MGTQQNKEYLKKWYDMFQLASWVHRRLRDSFVYEEKIASLRKEVETLRQRNKDLERQLKLLDTYQKHCDKNLAVCSVCHGKGVPGEYSVGDFEVFHTCHGTGYVLIDKVHDSHVDKLVDKQ